MSSIFLCSSGVLIRIESKQLWISSNWRPPTCVQNIPPNQSIEGDTRRQHFYPPFVSPRVPTPGTPFFWRRVLGRRRDHDDLIRSTPWLATCFPDSPPHVRITNEVITTRCKYVVSKSESNRKGRILTAIPTIDQSAIRSTSLRKSSTSSMHDPSSPPCVARSPPLTNSRAIKREPRQTKKATRARFGRSPFLDSCSAFIASFLRFPVVHAFDGREREIDLRLPAMDVVLCVSYQFLQIGRLSRSASTTH